LRLDLFPLERTEPELRHECRHGRDEEDGGAGDGAGEMHGIDGRRLGQGVSPALAHHLSGQGEERLGVPGQDASSLRRAVGNLPQQQAGQAGARPDVVHPGRDRGLDAGCEGPGRAKGFAGAFEQAAEDTGQHGVVELTLVAKVVDDGRASDPYPLGHVLEAGGVEAPLGEERLRRVQNRAPRTFGAGCPTCGLCHAANLPARR
jgi:hypothetical protein